MNRSERNRVNMYRTVRDWLTSNSSLTASLAAIGTLLEKLRVLLDEIDELDTQLTRPTSDVATSKHLARESLKRLTFNMVKSLKAYALLAKDPILLERVDFTKSRVYYSTEQVLLSRAQNMLKEAQQLLQSEDRGAALDEVKITRANVAALQEAHKAFASLQSSIRTSTIERKDNNTIQSEKISEAGALIDTELDTLIDLFEEEHPDLYQQYKDARQIVDR